MKKLPGIARDLGLDLVGEGAAREIVRQSVAALLFETVLQAVRRHLEAA